jgi:filamentous hemagglutinin
VKGWDAQQLQKEIDTQVAITQEFSKQAPKAIADFADKQIKALEAENASPEEIAKWADGGIYRVALHTVSGALTGGLGGAAGAAAAAGSAKLLDDLQVMTVAALVDQGMSPESAKALAQVLAEATSLGIGAAVGGTPGAASSLSVDTNNRQLHDDEKKKAAMLSATSGGKYTAAQIEEAMRAAGNTKYGETVTSGMVVSLTSETKAGQLLDTKGMVLTDDGAGHFSMVQQVSQHVDPALAAYIQASTGGSSSPYKWDPVTLGQVTPGGAETSVNPFIPNANGCVTAECAAGVLPNATDKAGENRFVGIVQIAGGSTQSLGGGSLVGIGLGSCVETLGAGCLVAAFGGYQMLTGWDNVNAGTKNVLDGTLHATTGGIILQQTGVSPGMAELLYGGTQIAAGFGGGYTVVKFGPSLNSVGSTTSTVSVIEPVIVVNENSALNAAASTKVGSITAPIDFDGHIINAEIKSNGNVVGGHSIAGGEVRVIPGSESPANAQGVYIAKIEVADPSNPGSFLPKGNNNGESTMFPKSWTADRIKVEVDAAFQNKTVIGNKWQGITPSGVKVEGYLNPKTTVYPKL